ncbi:MAG: N-acetylneuraminate synthase family protein [Gammaproteobacteria bacterium]
MKIGSFTIGKPLDPYIIAEAGVNHENKVELALKLAELAREGGANAIKFQTYKAEKIARRDSPAYWDTSKEPTPSQFLLFKKYDSFNEPDYRRIAEHCARIGIDFMSTPFDLDAAAFLAPLMPAYKIASADINNVPLLRAVARHGKPVILSTGAATLAEICFAIETLEAAGNTDVALLHCVLNYPTAPEHAQLGYIRVLAQRFPGIPIGYSDHVPPDPTVTSSQQAALLGACIIEKHFTHDKTLPGNDHYHAMDRDDLRRLREALARHRQLHGNGTKDLRIERAAIRHARRSIVAARAIKKGEVLDDKNLIALRPAHGISAALWDQVAGRKAAEDIPAEALIEWHHLA